MASAAQGVHSRRDCGKIAFEIPIPPAITEYPGNQFVANAHQHIDVARLAAQAEGYVGAEIE